MHIGKKTKVVATIGPVTESTEMLEKLVVAGMNVMRLNFSHGDHAEHGRRVENLREVTAKSGQSIGILQDLAGPKIRIGEFYKERVILKEGDTFVLTTKEVVGDEHKVHVNYPNLPKELVKGNAVLLDDGKKRLEVTGIKDDEVHCVVVVGGETKGRRGVNLPGANLSISSITEKDRRDLVFGIEHEVDYIALSFVRRPEDIDELRAILTAAKSEANIIAKIETQEAVDNIDEIIARTDAVMVARGDLAIEIPAEKVPLVQKSIIEKCNKVGKPVITATQMLESMIKSPVPTRAEVSDIANAILDGTDAIMLSEETTLGSFPVEAVKVMTRVALEIEKDYPERFAWIRSDAASMGVADSITGSVVNTAHDVGAKLVFALTESGFTARMLSRFKPEPFVIAITPKEKTARQLALSWGVYPVLIDRVKTLEGTFKTIRTFCLKNKLADKGDKVVIAAGAPFNDTSIPTNMLLVEEL